MITISKIKSKNIVIAILLVAVTMLVFGCIFSKDQETAEEPDTTLVVDEAGTVELGDQYKEVIINVPGVQLENGSADSILVAEGVGDGEVTLLNVKSKELKLQGGGPNSITIAGSSEIQSIRLERVDGTIRVVVTDNSAVESVKVYEGSQDVILEGVFADISIEASDIDVNIKDATMDTLSVSGTGTTVYVDEKSTIQSATILEGADDSKIVVDGSIENLTLEAKESAIEVNGEVGSIDVKDDAENASINLTKKASVERLMTLVPVTLSGEGTFDEVNTDLASNIKGNAKVKKTILLKENGDPVEETEDSTTTTGTGRRPSTGTSTTPATGTTGGTGTTGTTTTPPTTGGSEIATPSIVVNGISVKTSPTKITYKDGDSLKLYGLVVTLAKSNGTNEDVTIANFASKGIKTSKNSGDTLGVTDKNITITHTASGKSVNQKITVNPIMVSAITVTGEGDVTTITTDKGTLQMKADVKPTNANNKEITWSVDNESIAIINANSGLLKAVANGTVTVKATAKDGSGVVGEKSITISGQLLPSTIVFADDTVSKVYGEPAFTNTISGVGTGAVTYSSSAEEVATIDTNGEVTIVGVGTTEITATKAATATHTTVTETYTLTVTKKELTVSGLIAKYNPGATAGIGTVTIEGTPALVGIVDSDDVTITGTATGSIAGSSISETVTITGLSLAGTKAGNYTLTLPTNLTVDATKVLEASTIVFANGATVSKVYGTTGYINTVSGDGAGTITYSSENTGVATVDSSSGEVTIVGVGTTEITAVKAATATHATVTKTYTLTVTAKPLEGIAPISGTAKVGETLTAGNVTPSEATFNYQWLICDTADGTYANIDGATNKTYTILAENAGKYIKVVATGTGNYGDSKTSDVTAAVANAEQEAPTGLAGVTPTSTANNDGKITGTTTEMEYKLSSESDWTKVTATEVTGLAAGTYNVRYAAKTGYNAGASADVIVPEYTKSSDAGVSSVKVAGKTAIVDTSNSKIYNVELPAGTDLSTLTATDVVVTKTDTNATVATANTSDSGATWTVIVTAEDGTTKITYTINVTVAPNKVVDKLSLDSLVIKPVKDATPITTAIDGEQYTGEVTWFKSDETTAVTGDFAADTVYVAKVTLTAKTGYTFNGVLANKFTYTGATVTNAADSGEVMITFPATAKADDIAVTATVVGSLTETDPLGPITINLSPSITNLQWNDIKVYKNGIENDQATRAPSGAGDSVAIQFYSTTGIKYGDEITVTITKSGYSINDGNPITIANDIPGYNLTVEDGVIVSSGDTTGTYIKGARIEIKAEEKVGKVFTKWTYSDTKPINWDATPKNKEEITINMPAGPVTLTPTYTDRKINIDGTIHHLSDVSDPVLPSGLTWDETNKTLNMDNYKGGYIHKETLENITINLEGTNELITEVNIEVLSFSHGITIKGSGKLTLQSPDSRLVYQGGISYSTIIEDSAEVTVNILNESAYLNQANGFDGSTIVKGKLIVNAPLKSGKEKRRLSVLRSYNITVEDSGSVYVNLATEAGKNNAVYIDSYVPRILGQYNSTGRYYEKAAYKVEGSWTASDGTSTNPIKLTYTVADDIATLYTPDAGATDDVHVNIGTAGTVKMYDGSFAGSEIANKTLDTGPNTIYIKTTIGGVDKYYEITVNRDAAEVADVLADKAALTADSIKGANTDLDHITVALINPLPSTGTNGSTIAWASDKPEVVSSDGQTINRPIVGAGNEIVTLKATLTKETVTETKEFILTVLALEPEALSGIVTISGDLKFGKELTANLADTNNTGTLSYTWKRGTTSIGSNQATYTTVADDIGQQITCLVTSSVETGTVTGTTSGTIGKADGPASPAGISKTDETKTGLKDGTLTGVEVGQEYQVNGAGAWIPITGDTVTGLAPGSYTVRIAETTIHKAGTATSVIEIAAGTEKQDGPAAPAGISKTDETRKGLNDGSLTGVVSGQEYQVNGAGAWIPITGDTVTGLAPGNYTVRIAETTTHKAGIPTEALVIAASTELQDGPEAPLVESFKTSGEVENMIMLKNDGTNFTIKVGANKINLYEYSIGETDSWTYLTTVEKFTDAGDSILIRAKETGTHKAGEAAKVILTDGYVFNRNTGTIINYAGTEKDLSIPSSIKIDGVDVNVTKIDAEAFKGKELTLVTIPETVITIGNNAFRNNALTSIVIPNSVTHIATSAFEENQLTEITISDSIYQIGFTVFKNNKLTEVKIPASVKVMYDNVFQNNGQSSNSEDIPGDVADKRGKTWGLVGDGTTWTVKE